MGNWPRRRPHAVLPRADGAPAAAHQDLQAYEEAHQTHQTQDAAPPRSPLFLRARGLVADRFWLEKALAVADAAQLFALLWQLSQPWPWPARWLRATRWVNAFSLDALSFRATGAAMGATAQAFSLWGEMRHYWAYALVWGLLPPCSALALRAASLRWRWRGDAGFLERRTRWENMLLQVFQVLYLPVGLAIFRLVNCDAGGGVSVDPSGLGACGGARHVVSVVLITGILGGGFLIGFPLILNARIRSSLVHDNPDEHERMLRSKELEYVLGTSEAYLELYMPQYASFRREAAMAPVEACLFKLLLLLVFTMLRSPAPRTDNQSLQGILFFALLAIRATRQATRRLYRCGSSSVVARVVSIMVTADGLLGLLCASGVRSALTVSTAMTSMLTFLNVTFLVILALLILKAVHAARSHDSSQSGATFWLSRRDVKDDMLADPNLVTIVAALHDAKALVREALLLTPSMRSFNELDEVLRRLEVCYSQAIETRHYLSDQLRDTMFLVSDVFIDATASNPFHRGGFPKDELRQLGSVRRRQRKNRLLMAPIAQRVLMKLEAGRAWKAAVRPPLPSSLSAGDAAQPSRESSDTAEIASVAMGSKKSRNPAVAQVI